MGNETKADNVLLRCIWTEHTSRGLIVKLILLFNNY